jgi:hypothetical protein
MKEKAPCRIQARNEQSINTFHAVMATQSRVTKTMPPSLGQKKNSMFPHDIGTPSMKAVSSSTTLVPTYHTAWCHKQYDINSHCHQNPKPYIKNCSWKTTREEITFNT